MKNLLTATLLKIEGKLRVKRNKIQKEYSAHVKAGTAWENADFREVRAIRNTLYSSMVELQKEIKRVEEIFAYETGKRPFGYAAIA